MSTEWYALDTQKLFTPQKQKIGGVTVDLFLPANLIPVALKGNLDSITKLFVIEFRYIGDLQSHEIKEFPTDDQAVSLFAESSTGRITKLVFDTKKMKEKRKFEVEVNFKIKETFSQIEQTEEYSKFDFFKSSMKVVKEAIQMKPEIFSHS